MRIQGARPKWAALAFGFMVTACAAPIPGGDLEGAGGKGEGLDSPAVYASLLAVGDDGQFLQHDDEQVVVLDARTWKPRLRKAVSGIFGVQLVSGGRAVVVATGVHDSRWLLQVLSTDPSSPGQLLQEVDLGHSVHAMAEDPDRKLLYVYYTNAYGRSRMAVFDVADLSTMIRPKGMEVLKPHDSVPFYLPHSAGASPLNPTAELHAMDLVVDPATGWVAGTGPHDIFVLSYAEGEGFRTIWARYREESRRDPNCPPCEADCTCEAPPNGMFRHVAIDPDRRRFYHVDQRYNGTEQHLYAYDFDTGKPLLTTADGKPRPILFRGGPAAGIGSLTVHPTTGDVYVTTVDSSSDGYFYHVDPDSLALTSPCDRVKGEGCTLPPAQFQLASAFIPGTDTLVLGLMTSERGLLGWDLDERASPRPVPELEEAQRLAAENGSYTLGERPMYLSVALPPTYTGPTYGPTDDEEPTYNGDDKK